jgi:signal transduction histidine kinase
LTTPPPATSAYEVDIALSPLIRGNERSLIHALLCSTDYGILMTDHEGQDVLCNPRFGELFDLDPSLVVNSTKDEVRMMALERVKDPARFVEVIERIYTDTELEHEDEIEVKSRPPRVVLRHTGPVYDAQGKNIGRVWTFRDITETRRLQGEVRSYASKLEAQVKQQAADLQDTGDVLTAMTGVFQVLLESASLDDVVVSIPKVVAGVLDFDTSAILIRGITGGLTGSFCRAGGEPAPMVISEEASHALETACLTGSAILEDPPTELADRLKSKSMAVTALHPRQGVNLGYLIFSSSRRRKPLDLSRHPHIQSLGDQVALALDAFQLHSDLQHAYDRLQSIQKKMVEAAKLGAVGVLGASIAHDIRNIMTPLRLEIQMLAGNGGPDDALAQVDRLFALTNRLLSFARPTDMRQEPIDLTEVANRVISLIRPQADVDRIAVETDFEACVPEVMGDAPRLEQMLTNLFLNALNSMSAKGGTLFIGIHSESDGVIIEVRDTGKGILASHQAHIFDPFFTTRANGTGLGLFSVKTIVEEHGGRIGLESNDGAGACFSIWLPRAEGLSGARALVGVMANGR